MPLASHAMRTLMVGCVALGATRPPNQADPAITFQRSDGIWVMNTNGSNCTRIRPTGSSPSWSPDGSSIAFLENVNGSLDVWKIQVSVLNGVPVSSNPTMVYDAPSSAREPAWSPAGDVIAFIDGGVQGVFDDTLQAIDANGGVPVVLYVPPAGTELLSTPTWSPDATMIAFAEIQLPEAGGAQFVKVLDLVTSSVTTVAGPPFMSQFTSYTELEWARTQDKLALSVSTLEGSSGLIYTLNLQNGQLTLVHNAGNLPFRTPQACWSPDDSAMVFLAIPFKLKKLNPATGKVTNLNGPPSSSFLPDWRRL
jgi:Tol biopolymer transport system component